MPEAPKTPYVLAIDLGARSIGWAVVALEKGAPRRLLDAGVRCFEAGVGKGQIEAGTDEAPGVARRKARQQRVQTRHRRSRRRGLLKLLATHGLLPRLVVGDGESLHQYFLALDAELRAAQGIPSERIQQQVLFYGLRAKALDEELPLHHLGRVLYQLGYRRGFLSNRKHLKKKDEEEGKVLPAITELAQRMKESGARTLGEYLSRLDPEEERIRRRWTARSMYQEEFAAIWASQSRFHPELTPELRKELEYQLFFQRPLKSQKHLVGRCDLEPVRKRAPLACREAQRFRVLQALNNLRVSPPDSAAERELTQEEREALLRALTTTGDLTFAAARKLLKLPKGSEFNLERGGEKRLVGHRTDAKLRAAFGERWEVLPEETRSTIVDQVLAIDTAEAIARKAKADWGLAEEPAAVLAKTDFEPGYAAFSRRALTRLVAAMEDGTPFATARKAAYPESFATRPPQTSLPPVLEAVPSLRNPAVLRALTELRKVVNALLPRWQQPDLIRLELARDLRNSRDRRQRMAKDNRERESTRESARRKLVDGGIPAPSRDDVERYLLAEECGWECPYTGRRIGFADLFGDHSQYDVEHIWPLSRSLDNSFLNKTLCYAPENRDRKRNRTPFEAYGADKERLEAIQDRVAKFRGFARLEKLRRFAVDEIPQGFTERHLQDTRYATKLALQFLGALYGGTSDAEGKLRVQAGTGGLTALVRAELGLNRLLGSGPTKERTDHRHHAIDAVAIALTDLGMVKRLSDAAERAPAARRRAFAPIEAPWESFLEDVRSRLDAIVVSHRVDRRISGPLHKEKNYSRLISPRRGAADGERRFRIRKLIHELTAKDVANIPDPAIRETVRAKLTAVGGDPKKLENDPPIYRPPHGRAVVVRKVRLDVAARLLGVGSGPGERRVESGSNHHLAFVAVLGPDGTETKWEGHLVSRFEAHRRLAAREPVVRRDWGEGRSFKFSLASGDTVVLSVNGAPERLAKVRTITEYGGQGRVDLSWIEDARLVKAIPKEDFPRLAVNSLRPMACRKVIISPIGEVLLAHD